MLIYAYKAYASKAKEYEYILTSKINLYLYSRDISLGTMNDIMLIQTTMDKLLKHRNYVAYPDIEMIVDLRDII